MYDKALIISRYHSDLGNPIYNAYTRGIKSQCEEVYFIDYFDDINEFSQKGFEQKVLTLLEEKDIKLVFFIFVSGDAILSPYFIQNVAKDRFIAMVFWDIEQFFEPIDRYYAQLADLVILTANYEYSYILKTMGIDSICPFSLFDSTKYKPTLNNQQTIDVSFVGEVTKGKRKEYIKYLEDNGINIQTYGVGTKNGKVSFEKVVDIFNSSKINLSFTGTYDNSVYSFCSNINNRIKQNKGKPIEIALCGGFVLSEYVNGLDKVFPNNSIDVFETKEELLQKVKYYLNHNDLREEMKDKSYKYAIENYDSIVAFKKIFEKINSMEYKKEKKLILDDIFIKVHNTFRIFYAILFLINSKYSFFIDELKFILKYKKFILKDVKEFIWFLLKNKFKKIKFKFAINKIFSSLKNQDVVIYGAGVHTIKLFEMFPILKNLNVKAIVDSNPNLWGTYINGIIIISPNDILEYADKVIISSAKFEKEIKSNLIKLYQKRLNIFTLYHKFNYDFVSGEKDAYQVYRNTLKLR